MSADRMLLVASRGDSTHTGPGVGPSGPGAGIYLVDTRDPDARPRRLAEVAGLSCLAWHPILPVLYGLAGGEVVAWRVAEDHALQRLGALALPDGGACHAAVAPDGRTLVAAMYESGQVAFVGLGPDGGPGACDTIQLTGSGPDPERQEAAHPHHVLVTGETTVLVTDLGADLLRTVDLGTRTVIDERTLPPGSGPRHTALLRDGLVTTGELDVSLIRTTGTDTAAERASSRRPDERVYPSDLAVDSASGRVVVANRGAHTLAWFEVGPDGPSRVGEVDAHGAWPLNLEPLEDGLAVANRDASLVALFRWDAEGELTFDRGYDVPRPVWVLTTRA
ncbi:lactonase family protein [Actinopolymorpha pittospori]